jgi:hypothetical protein
LWLTALGCAASIQHAHAAPPEDAADAARRAAVVATYAGGEITVGEVELAIGTASPTNLSDLSSPHMVHHWYLQTLKDELLLGEAQRRDYAHNPEVERRIKELSMDLMLHALINEPLEKWTPSQQELQEFFQSHQSEVSAPELRRVTQIVVATEAQARALLPSFQAAASPAAVRELVQKHSLDEVTRKEDGYSRYFDRNGQLDDKSTSVDPALAKAAFALSGVGATSDVVALGGAQKRFALLKLLAVRPAYSPSLQQASSVVKKLLTDEKRELDRAALEQDVRKRTPPVYHDELLKLLPADLTPPVPNNN